MKDGHQEANKKHLYCVIHHPNLRQEKLWEQEIRPYWSKIFDYLINNGINPYPNNYKKKNNIEYLISKNNILQ